MTLPGFPNNQSKSSQGNNNSALDVKSGSPNVSPESSPRPPSRSIPIRDSTTPPKDCSPPNNDKQEQSENISPKIESGSTTGYELSRSNSQEPLRERKSQERIKKKPRWYSAFYPTYKSRSDDFKRMFKDVPAEERLVVDYSCAIQRDILVHGRLYVSQNYLCFYANIFRWETQVVLPWKDVTALTKEKTAILIPNAILIHTNSEKHFFTSFAARDKAYVMLFRVWQSALINQPLSMTELFQWVRSCYGDELGLTSDDDDYHTVNPDDDKQQKCDSNSLQSYSEESLSLSMSMGEQNGGCLSDKSDLLDGIGSLPLPSPSQLQQVTPTDTVPSDLSDDSSISESESEKQGELVICPVEHEGKLMLHMQVSIHVDQLFTHLFTNSKFFSDLQETRNSTDVKQSPWVMNPSTNEKDRTVSLTVNLGQAVGPKQVQVTETQKMLPCSKPGEMYAIEIESSNAGVPYADSFYVARHYCLTRGADPNTSTIAVYCQIKYKKSVWTIVKTFIEKNCFNGLNDYYSALVKALEVECERTRRAMVAGVGVGKRKLSRRRTCRSVGVVDDVCPTPEPYPLPHIPLTQALVPPPFHRTSVVPQPHSPRTRSDPLGWFVFLVLLCLLVINAALYYKLWGLEQASKSFQLSTETVDLHLASRTPQNDNEWRSLLQQQERLHSAEVERWVRILKAAVHLLQQVEHSLSGLQRSIQGMVGDSVFANYKETNESPTANDEL